MQHNNISISNICYLICVTIGSTVIHPAAKLAQPRNDKVQLRNVTHPKAKVAHLRNDKLTVRNVTHPEANLVHPEAKLAHPHNDKVTLRNDKSFGTQIITHPKNPVSKPN